jgi:hypothetical protein
MRLPLEVARPTAGTQQNQQLLRVWWGVELAATFNDLTTLREARPLSEINPTDGK